MLRFLLGFLSGALVRDALRRLGLPTSFSLTNQDLTIEMNASGNWFVSDGQGPAQGPPKIKKGGTITWKLTDGGPQFAVIQVEPDYFTHQAGSDLSEDGIAILVKQGTGGTANHFVRLKVGSPNLFFAFDYTYSVLCMNPTGSVAQVQNDLSTADVEGFLGNLDLTLARGQSPPRMIIKG